LFILGGGLVHFAGKARLRGSFHFVTLDRIAKALNVSLRQQQDHRPVSVNEWPDAAAD
jgi:hypothetical protein